jgi:hypothetical protein
MIMLFYVCISIYHIDPSKYPILFYLSIISIIYNVHIHYFNYHIYHNIHPINIYHPSYLSIISIYPSIISIYPSIISIYPSIISIYHIYLSISSIYPLSYPLYLLSFLSLDVDFYANGLFNHDITSTILSSSSTETSSALIDAYHTGMYHINKHIS